MQILVRREKPLPVHQIEVVLVVENVGAANIHESPVVSVAPRAGELEVIGEGLVHGGVLIRVQPGGEGRTLTDADSVGPGERHQIVDVEIEPSENIDESRRVRKWRGKKSQSGFSGGEGYSISSSGGDLVIWTAGLPL